VKQQILRNREENKARGVYILDWLHCKVFLVYNNVRSTNLSQLDSETELSKNSHI